MTLRSLYPHKAVKEHIAFSPTRQTSRAPSASAAGYGAGREGGDVHKHIHTGVDTEKAGHDLHTRAIGSNYSLSEHTSVFALL